MRGDIPPLPQYVFMVWYLVKHKDNFTFYLYLPYSYLAAETVDLFIREECLREIWVFHYDEDSSRFLVWHRVVSLRDTKISEDLDGSIFRVTARSSDILVSYRIVTRRHIPEYDEAVIRNLPVQVIAKTLPILNNWKLSKFLHLQNFHPDSILHFIRILL
jgi:hypothetical protein